MWKIQNSTADKFVKLEKPLEPGNPRVRATACWGQILSFDMSRVVPRQSILARLRYQCQSPRNPHRHDLAVHYNAKHRAKTQRVIKPLATARRGDRQSGRHKGQAYNLNLAVSGILAADGRGNWYISPECSISPNSNRVFWDRKRETNMCLASDLDF